VSQSAVRVHDELRADILGGRCGPGSRLREEEIAERFGLSRTPVREALRRLEADGLVVVTPRRGAEVVRWRDDDIAELVELRALLEGHAARRAATGGGIDLVALAELCALMEEHGESGGDGRSADEITRLNMELHRAVHRAGGRLLPDLLTRLIDVPVVRRTFHTYSEAELRRSFAQHRELIEALAAGDGDWAAAVMQAHIRAAGATLRSRRDPEPAQAPGHPRGAQGADDGGH
jgi:DNA-binding GntR family transcriptional regulator